MSFRMTSCEEVLNYFKLRNGWLNSKRSAKRKLSHSDENAKVLALRWLLTLFNKVKNT